MIESRCEKASWSLKQQVKQSRLFVQFFINQKQPVVAYRMNSYVGSLIIQFKENMDHEHHEVIIIGAGASGIGAAITLFRNKIPFIVLEARDRIGGRLTSTIIDGVQVDLGGCWVHKSEKKNAITKEVKRLKWPEAKSSGKKQIAIDGETGEEYESDEQEVAELHSQKFYKKAQKAGKKSPQDISLYQAGRQYYEQVIQKLKPRQRRLTRLLMNGNQQYQAASIRELSAKHFGEDSDNDEDSDFLPEKSYASLMKKIAEQIQHTVQFNRVVEEINYENNIVEIRCQGGMIYKAKKVIAGIPLGLLKAKDINFVPQLPEGHQRAIDKLGNGLMNKIVVSFAKNFWGKYSWIGIGCEEAGKYPSIWNYSRDGRHILICFVSDDFAKKIQTRSDEEIMNDYIGLLKRCFKQKEIEVRDYKITRWSQDIFCKGSYSSFYVGATDEDCFRLREGINNRLWLVGEHCYERYIGSAHGAYQTGVWAAEHLLKTLK